jgi:hypothetical protein
LSNVNHILPMATPLLLDLAWAIVTVQLMIITFWLSSESIRQRFRRTPTLPPPPAAPQDNGDVVLKKRRRRLQPKSVWDMEQVTFCSLMRIRLLSSCDAGLHRFRARGREANVG